MFPTHRFEARRTAEILPRKTSRIRRLAIGACWTVAGISATMTLLVAAMLLMWWVSH